MLFAFIRWGILFQEEAVATAGIIYPVAVNTELVVWESAVFAYNDMYFTGGNVKSVTLGILVMVLLLLKRLHRMLLLLLELIQLLSQ